MQLPAEVSTSTLQIRFAQIAANVLITLTQEQEDVQLADKKDSEKRMFNWKVIGTASTLVLAAIGIGTAMLGGKFDVKLPIKK